MGRLVCWSVGITKIYLANHLSRGLFSPPPHHPHFLGSVCKLYVFATENKAVRHHINSGIKTFNPSTFVKKISTVDMLPVFWGTFLHNQFLNCHVIFCKQGVPVTEILCFKGFQNNWIPFWKWRSIRPCLGGTVLALLMHEQMVRFTWFRDLLRFAFIFSLLL